LEQGINTVRLEIGSSGERNISVAPGLNYTLVCVRSGGFSGMEAVWSKDGSLIPTDTDARVYARMAHNINWILTINNFESSDRGHYQCSSSGESLTLVISTGTFNNLLHCVESLLEQAELSISVGLFEH